MVNQYNTTRIVGGVNGEAYNVIAYNYQSGGNETITYFYVSNIAPLPIEKLITVQSGGSSTTVDLWVTDTNISGIN